jgi:hypothetical protein
MRPSSLDPVADTRSDQGDDHPSHYEEESINNKGDALR